MSENNQITTAIPKVTDNDETVVRPKAETEAADPSAIQTREIPKGAAVETRENPKLSAEAVNPEPPTVIRTPDAEQKTVISERSVAAANAAAAQNAPVADKVPMTVNPAVAEPTPAAEALAAAEQVVAADKAAVAERTASAELAAQAAAGPVRDRTGRVKTTSSGTVRPARKARLRIAKVDPWSVMKTALMFSVAAAIILFVAVALLWSVIEASGALDTLQETMNSLLGNPDGSGTVQVNSIIDRWRVLGFTAIVSGINVILLTALATLAAFLYNLSSTVLGGLDITLAED